MNMKEAAMDLDAWEMALAMMAFIMVVNGICRSLTGTF
jgi:hypothetical protein